MDNHWPLYQGVILASGILGIPVDHVAVINVPITAATLASGILISYREMKSWKIMKSAKEETWNIYHVWPFAAIAILTIVLKVNLVISLCMTLLLFALFYRPSTANLIRGLKSMFNPTFIGVIVISFMFSNYIDKE